MAKSIEILCPARLTLFSNAYESKNIKRFKIINQTISLYDKLEISEDRKKYDGIKIISSKNGLTFDQNNICYKTCSLFFEYTGINPNTFNVILEKGIPMTIDLAGSESLAAGLLKGLNEYYNTNLTKKQLMFLAHMIGDEVPYFLISGYAKIKDDFTNIEKIHDNPYCTYLIIEPDFLQKNTEEELVKLENILKLYFNSNYFILKKDQAYCIAFEDKYISPGLIIKLKKDFPNYKIYNCKNEIGHKMLIKYPSNLD